MKSLRLNAEGCQKNYKHKSIFEVAKLRPIVDDTHTQRTGIVSMADKVFPRKPSDTMHRTTATTTITIADDNRWKSE